MLLLTLLVLTHAHVITPLQNVIRIGGLFNAQEETEELAFRYAAEMINGDLTLLGNHTLMTHTEAVPEDSFQVSKTVCKLLQMGVVGIFGPQSSFTSHHVQSMCDSMDIPHVEIRPDAQQKRQDLMVNIYPHPPTLAKMLAEMVCAWRWEKFTVIYEDGAGLVRLSELIKFYNHKGHTVTVRQLDQSSSNQRPILQKIRDSGDKNIVLDCSIEKLPQVLRQAQQVGLMIAEYTYIITNLDMHTINLEPYQWSGTNITGLRMINPEDTDVLMTLKWWLDKAMRNRVVLDITPQTLRLSAALVYDAVHLFAKALDRLDAPSVEIKELDCNTDNAWNHGSSLLNFMRDGEGEHRGLTGLIQFDNEGFRSKFELEVVEVTSEGLKRVGTWNATEGFNFTRIPSTRPTGPLDLHNMTFRVLTTLEKPYGMRKNSSDQLVGNDRYEGYGIDLIKEISEILKFNYTLDIQEDGKNGGLNEDTNQWDGMVLALLEERADLAIADLTITAEREGAVDFTTPFMNLGISIVYKAPRKEDPHLFSFLTTFSAEVWYYMLAAYTGVSVVMFISGRISPKEWTNPYPCIEDPDEMENQFNLKNAFWFTIGTVMQQGTELAPIAMSTRIVAGIWSFFTLIMVSSYTANLAAVLTLEPKSSPFKNVEELANNKLGIMYGAKDGGSTVDFFKNSQEETYQRMWRFMDSHPQVFTNSNDEGISWVKDKPGGYAYFMESTSIEYKVERDCKVSQIGGQLDNKNYGIAMRKNSTYRNSLTTAVLRLQETGRLDKLKTRWWKEKGGGTCMAGTTNAGGQLTIKHVGGVFLVLGLGTAVSVLFNIIELVYEVSKIARQEKVPFSRVLIEELRFIIMCQGSTKPVRKYHHDSEDGFDLQNERNEDSDEPFSGDFQPDVMKQRIT